MIEVSNKGIISIENADIELYGENRTTIILAMTFDTKEDATRYYNSIRASINVGCIHIHVDAGEESVTH